MATAFSLHDIYYIFLLFAERKRARILQFYNKQLLKADKQKCQLQFAACLILTLDFEVLPRRRRWRTRRQWEKYRDNQL